MNQITNLIAVALATLAGASTPETNQPVACTGTLQVVTRVETSSNERGCATCETLRQGMLTGMVPAIYHPWCGIQGPRREATERWITTNMVAIERFTVVRLSLGESLTNQFVHERILWSVTQHEVLTSQWGPTPTNAKAPGTVIFQYGDRCTSSNNLMIKSLMTTNLIWIGTNDLAK